MPRIITYGIAAAAIIFAGAGAAYWWMKRKTKKGKGSSSTVSDIEAPIVDVVDAVPSVFTSYNKVPDAIQVPAIILPSFDLDVDQIVDEDLAIDNDQVFEGEKVDEVVEHLADDVGQVVKDNLAVKDPLDTTALETFHIIHEPNYVPKF